MSKPVTDPFFTPLDITVKDIALPLHFSMMENGTPPALCIVAAKHLQQYLQTQDEWSHNFGLSDNASGTVIGKMFGVLVVKDVNGVLGFLSAFSGKLAGGNHHSKFVPPVFDSLTDNSFVNVGMTELTRINQQIKLLESETTTDHKQSIISLKDARRKHSNALQYQIFEHYHFLNKAGEEKSLNEIFKIATYKNPPAGAGECAGPKLLQYAFLHKMQPIALAEFWWGQSPKSDYWKHLHFYACCKEKCEPILAHMLVGIDA